MGIYVLSYNFASPELLTKQNNFPLYGKEGVPQVDSWEIGITLLQN
jgi:hypothetical protein